MKHAELDWPAAVAALAPELADPDLEVRAAAGLALAKLRDPASIPALARIVATWHEPVLARCRRAALHALVAFQTADAAVELARVLATRAAAPLDLHERSVLLAVAYAEPAGVAAPRTVRALVAMLAHEDHAVADRATSLLTLFPAESHGPLERALRTAAGQVRRRAARALGACRQEAAVSALITALGDPDPGVRAAAASSLGQMRDPATATALQAAGGDGDESVRTAARLALERLVTVGSAAGFGFAGQSSGG